MVSARGAGEPASSATTASPAVSNVLTQPFGNAVAARIDSSLLTDV
jgi:hypothetical protein